MKQDKKITGILAMSIFIEAIITYVGQICSDGSVSWKMIFSLILGIITAIAYSFDLPEYFELKSKVPLIGNIITGVIISRGSNYVWSIISKISDKL